MTIIPGIHDYSGDEEPLTTQSERKVTAELQPPRFQVEPR